MTLQNGGKSNSPGISNSEPNPQERAEEPVPVCPHCLHPVDPRDYYCPHCGEDVGRFTPYLPFINIPFTCNFLARIWHKLFDRSAGILTRVFCLCLVILFAPILLLGLLFRLWDKFRKRKQ